MITYFVMFLIPAFIAINNKVSNNIIWLITGFFYTILIGLRHYVGGDFQNYLRRYEEMKFETFETVLKGEDPGYYLLNLLMHELDLGIYGVNFICAAIFMYGIIKFMKEEYNPMLMLAVAVPYTITVVAMGYTRQAVALGFVLWALHYLQKNKMLPFFILVTLAATFHKSAVLIIGLGIFSHGGGTFIKIIAVSIIGIGIWSTFLSQYQDRLITNYVDAQMQSSGALIRTFMNLIPSILLIIYRKRWKEYFDDFKFWFIIAILSIISFALVGLASTAVDRMALYLIPIQLIVFGRLAILMSHQVPMQLINIGILLYYGLVLIVWLNFAVNAFAWVPYDNLIFQGLF